MLKVEGEGFYQNCTA